MVTDRQSAHWTARSSFCRTSGGSTASRDEEGVLREEELHSPRTARRGRGTDGAREEEPWWRRVNHRMLQLSASESSTSSASQSMPLSGPKPTQSGDEGATWRKPGTGGGGGGGVCRQLRSRRRGLLLASSARSADGSGIVARRLLLGPILME